MRLLVLVSAVLLLVVCAAPAKPASSVHAPAWFVKQALCVHSHEAPSWRWGPRHHPGYSYWNGYYTGLQFLRGTWERANVLLGRSDHASTGKRYLIVLHAYAIYRQDGNSWREWPNTSRLCGLR